MVWLAAHRDRRFDSRLFASLDIARAEIAGVRQQSFGLAQGLGQCVDLAQHRLDLVLVVGRLDHVGRHHQQAADGDRRLRVVALIEAAAGHRHDAQVFIGQIDLIARQLPLGRRLRRLAARLLARRRRLGRARRHFGFVLRHLARMAFLGPRLDLRPRLGDLAYQGRQPRSLRRDLEAAGDDRVGVRTLELVFVQ